MNIIEASLFILFIAIISVPIATRLRIPLEIFLFLGSCLISLTPKLPSIKLDPNIVFDIFLPPILFAAAYFSSIKDLKFNLRPIVQLALGLVIFTAVLVAVVAKFLLPDFTWAEAFLLGAIVSPTDASAATSIIRKLGAPKRIIVVLEGESLVNDATALMIYRFSLAAILYGTFSFPHAVESFFILTLGGVVAGLCIAVAAAFVFRQINNTHAETTFTFMTAFAAYLIAEHLGFSGVISTVTAGLYFGIRFPELASSDTKLNANATWSTMLFIINGFAFTLIGFQIPVVLKNIEAYSLTDLIIYGTVISLVVILIRLIWIYPSAYIPRKLFPSIAKKDPMPSTGMLFIIGWAGMRGIVSLAAVLAIPFNSTEMSNPHLGLLIFITYCVIGTTLLLPTISLPYLIKVFKLAETRDILKEEATARLRIIEEVIKVISAIAKAENISDPVFNEFIKQFERKQRIISTHISETPYSMLTDDYFSLKRLTLLAIKAERETLIRLRKIGEIHDEIFWRLSDELDLEEIRAKSLRL
ncbi:MAG: Na+/H+ antiporter [Candidatus Berkiellales bacterium]